MDAVERYTEELSVPSMVTDTRDRLSVPGLARLFEEMAWQHARRLGVDFTGESDYFWVLSRLRVRVTELPVWSQGIQLETWPSGVERLFACREFRLSTNSSSESSRDLIVATSRWLVMSAENGRPVPPRRALDTDAIPTTERILREEPEKLHGAQDERPPDAGSPASEIIVRYSDLDRNRHTNNSRYITWMLDALSPQFHEEHAIADFDVNFTAESHYGDELRVFTSPVTQQDSQDSKGEAVTEFRPRIVRSRDSTTVALARFKFLATATG